MITTKSTYLLSPIHEIKPLASERFSLDEMHNFFSVESMKTHEKSCFVCSDLFSTMMCHEHYSPNPLLCFRVLPLCAFSWDLLWHKHLFPSLGSLMTFIWSLTLHVSVRVNGYFSKRYLRGRLLASCDMVRLWPWARLLGKELSPGFSLLGWGVIPQYLHELLCLPCTSLILALTWWLELLPSPWIHLITMDLLGS